MATVVILAAGAAVWYLTWDWGAALNNAVSFGCFSSAFLFVSLRNFFLPTKITLDETGIAVKKIL